MAYCQKVIVNVMHHWTDKLVLIRPIHLNIIQMYGFSFSPPKKTLKKYKTRKLSHGKVPSETPRKRSKFSTRKLTRMR